MAFPDKYKRIDEMSVGQLLNEVSNENMVLPLMNEISKKKYDDIQKVKDELDKKLEGYTRALNKFNRQLKSLQKSRSNPAFKNKWKDIEQAIRNVKEQRFYSLVEVYKMKCKFDLLDLILKEMLKVAIKPVGG